MRKGRREMIRSIFKPAGSDPWRKFMASRLIIDGNSVYEIDEDCERQFLSEQKRRQEKMVRTGAPARLRRRRDADGKKRSVNVKIEKIRG